MTMTAIQNLKTVLMLIEDATYYLLSKAEFV